MIQQIQSFEPSFDHDADVEYLYSEQSELNQDTAFALPISDPDSVSSSSDDDDTIGGSDSSEPTVFHLHPRHGWDYAQHREKKDNDKGDQKQSVKGHVRSGEEKEEVRSTVKGSFVNSVSSYSDFVLLCWVGPRSIHRGPGRIFLAAALRFCVDINKMLNKVKLRLPWMHTLED
ncbi:hypothetical protein ACOSQ4_008116 [Xanthoceras sorbifolium]